MKTTTLTKVGRTSLGFGLLIGLTATTLLFAPIATAAPHAARPAETAPTGDGVIKGKVLLGKKPLGGIPVTLVGVPDTGNNLSLSATTDPSGGYAFPKLPTGTSWGFSVSARYDGALFSTDQIVLQAGQTSIVNTPVYPPTSSPAAITTQAIAIWVDYTGNKMAVQQDLQFVNSAKTAYVGTTQVKVDNVPTPTAVSLSLAPGFKNLQYLGRFQTCCSVTSGTQWLNTRPIQPGTSRGTVRFEAPVTHNLAFPLQFETKAVAILIPKGVSATIPGFSAVGTKSDTGTTYNVYQGGPLAPASVVTITLGNPPRNWTLIIVIAGALLVVVGLIVWFVLARRNRQRRAAATAGWDPRTGTYKMTDLKAYDRELARQQRQQAKKQKKQESEPAATSASTTSAVPASPKKPEPAPAPAPTTTPAPASAGTPMSQQNWSDLADQLARLDLAYESGQLTDAATYAKLREGLIQKLMSAEPPPQ